MTLGTVFNFRTVKEKTAGVHLLSDGIHVFQLIISHFHPNLLSIQKGIRTFANLNRKKMATPVKNIPTLRGDSAKAFIARAEERERNPRHFVVYTENEERSYFNMLRKSGMLND